MHKNLDKSSRPAGTAVILIVLVLINLIVTILFNMYNLNIDLTRNKLYQFSERTYKVLEGLSEEIRFVYIGNYEAAQNNYHTQITVNFLERYKKASPWISVIYVDPTTNPNVMDSYRREGIIVQENSIVLESAKRKRHYYPYDMFTADVNTGEIYTVQAERQLTAGLIYVTGEMNLNAVFVAGHGETASASLINVFEQMGFTLRSPIVLADKDFEEQTVFAVIASPVRDFDKSETDKLDEFMAKGGKLMLFLTPTTIEFPNLKSFLMNWGIFIYSVTVFDESRHIGNNPLNIYADYTDHDLNQFFINSRYYVVMPNSLALEKLPRVRAGTYHEELLMSGNSSYAKLNYKEGAETARGNVDLSGPLTIATLITYANPDGNKANQNGMLFVSASGNMYGDSLAGSGSFANGSYLSALVKYCEAESVHVNIMPKNLFLSTLNLPNTHAWVWKVIFMGLVPLAILAAGAVVIFRRLRK